MKYCAQCGEKLEDYSRFCSCCGAPQPVESAPAEAAEEYTAGETVLLDQTSSPFETQAQQGYAQQGYAQPAYDPNGGYAPAYAGMEAAPVKTKKKKTGLIIALCALAALIAAAALLFVTGAYASLIPHSKLKLGLAEKKLVSSSENRLGEGLSLLFEGFDFSFDLSAEVEPYEEDGYYSENYEMLKDVKLQGGLKTGEELKLGVKGEYKGNTAVDLRLFADKDRLGLYLSPASDEFYTADIAKLLEKYAPHIDADKLAILFKKLDREKLKADKDAIWRIAADTLSKAEIEISKNESVKLFNADKVEGCAVYTIKLTEDEIEKLILAIADYLDSDECYIADYIDEFIQLADELGMDLDVGEPYADDPAPVHSMSDLTARMREKAPSAAASYVESGMLIEAVMKGSSIIRQRIYNDEAEVGYDSVTEGDTTHAMAYERSLDDAADSRYVDVTAKVNGSKAVIDATSFSYGEINFTVSADIDTAVRSAIGTCAGNYVIKAYDYYGDETVINVEVTRVGDGMLHHFDIEPDEDQAYYNDFRSIKGELLIKEGSGVERPAGAAEEDVSDYTEMQFTQLFYKLMSRFSSALSNIIDF